MEAKTNENHLAGATVAEKWFTDSSAALMEIYNKQLAFATNFYKNMAGISPVRNTKWYTGSYFADNFFMNNDLAKWMWSSFNVTNTNPLYPFMGSFDKIYSQLMEYNSNLLSMFNGKKTSGTEINPSSDIIRNKYQQAITNQIEISKKVTDSIVEAFNKQLGFATENDRKLMEELNERFNSAVKQSQEIWATILNPHKAPLKEETLSNENAGDVQKKQNKALVVA